MSRVVDIRYQNAISLRADHCNGRTKEFAQRVGKSTSTISKYLRKNKETRRPISDALARDTERAFGKSTGWLDHPSVLAIVLVVTAGRPGTPDHLGPFISIANVVEARRLTGGRDIFLRVEADSLNDLQDNVIPELNKIADVTHTETYPIGTGPFDSYFRD